MPSSGLALVLVLLSLFVPASTRASEQRVLEMTCDGSVHVFPEESYGFGWTARDGFWPKFADALFEHSVKRRLRRVCPGASDVDLNTAFRPDVPVLLKLLADETPVRPFVNFSAACPYVASALHHKQLFNASLSEVLTCVPFTYDASTCNTTSGECAFELPVTMARTFVVRASIKPCPEWCLWPHLRIHANHTSAVINAVFGERFSIVNDISRFLTESTAFLPDTSSAAAERVKSVVLSWLDATVFPSWLPNLSVGQHASAWTPPTPGPTTPDDNANFGSRCPLLDDHTHLLHVSCNAQVTLAGNTRFEQRLYLPRVHELAELLVPVLMNATNGMLETRGFPSLTADQWVLRYDVLSPAFWLRMLTQHGPVDIGGSTWHADTFNKLYSKLGVSSPVDITSSKCTLEDWLLTGVCELEFQGLSSLFTSVGGPVSLTARLTQCPSKPFAQPEIALYCHGAGCATFRVDEQQYCSVDGDCTAAGQSCKAVPQLAGANPKEAARNLFDTSNWSKYGFSWLWSEGRSCSYYDWYSGSCMWWEVAPSAGQSLAELFLAPFQEVPLPDVVFEDASRPLTQATVSFAGGGRNISSWKARFFSSSECCDAVMLPLNPEASASDVVSSFITQTPPDDVCIVPRDVPSMDYLLIAYSTIVNWTLAPNDFRGNVSSYYYSVRTAYLSAIAAELKPLVQATLCPEVQVVSITPGGGYIDLYSVATSGYPLSMELRLPAPSVSSSSCAAKPEWPSPYPAHWLFDVLQSPVKVMSVHGFTNMSVYVFSAWMSTPERYLCYDNNKFELTDVPCSSPRPYMIENFDMVDVYRSASGLAPVSDEAQKTGSCIITIPNNVNSWWDAQSAASLVAPTSTTGRGCPLWVTGAFTLCSPCVRTRDVACYDPAGGMNLPDENCTGLARPAAERTCPPVPNTVCVASWQLGTYGACGTQCTQTRTGDLCVNSAGATVDSSYCSSLSRPAAERPCSGSACVIKWVVGPFSACSLSCTQTATVTCTENDVTINDESICAAIAGKPPSRRSCEGDECAGKWSYGSWPLKCPSTCTKQRSATCTSASFATLPDSQCSLLTKEATSVTCTGDACPTFAWKTGTWGACLDTTCMRSRTVECESTAMPAGSTTPVTAPSSDIKCSNAGPKPAHTETCASCTCPLSLWGAWSPCSVSCAYGTQVRSRTITNGAQSTSAACQNVPLTEERACKMPRCSGCAGGICLESPPAGTWGSWSECKAASCSASLGYHYRACTPFGALCDGKARRNCSTMCSDALRKQQEKATSFLQQTKEGDALQVVFHILSISLSALDANADYKQAFREALLDDLLTILPGLRPSQVTITELKSGSVVAEVTIEDGESSAFVSAKDAAMTLNELVGDPHSALYTETTVLYTMGAEAFEIKEAVVNGDGDGTDGDDTSVPIGAVVGGAAAAVVLLLVLVGFLWRHKRAREARAEMDKKKTEQKKGRRWEVNIPEHGGTEEATEMTGKPTMQYSPLGAPASIPMAELKKQPR